MLWLKAFHLIAAIAWMAGLLYLPRLFVYHREALDRRIAEQPGKPVPASEEICATFQTMQYRLLRYITTPAMVVTWGLGLWLASWSGAFHSYWFLAKFILLIILSAFHMHLAVHRKRLTLDFDPATTKTASARYYRIINEIPTLILIAVVLLAVVKPF